MRLKVYIGVLLLLSISFALGELQERSTLPTEIPTAAGFIINAAGDKLVVHTAQHDYEFVLPSNRINLMIATAPPASGLGVWWIEKIYVSPKGRAKSVLHGRYGPGVNGVPFPSGDVNIFKALRDEPDSYYFAEINTDFEIFYSVELEEGQRFEPGAKRDFAGFELPQESEGTPILISSLMAEYVVNQKSSWLKSILTDPKHHR